MSDYPLKYTKPRLINDFNVYAHQGIRFNTVSPGGIDTALNANSQKLYPGLMPLGADGAEQGC